MRIRVGLVALAVLTLAICTGCGGAGKTAGSTRKSPVSGSQKKTDEGSTGKKPAGREGS